MCFLRKIDGKEEKVSADSSVSFCSAVVFRLKSVITPLLDIRMLLIIPLIAYSGLQQAFVWYCLLRPLLQHSVSSFAFFKRKNSIYLLNKRYVCNFRANYTKDVVNPILGEAGVGGAMAVYGAFDAIVST